MIPKSYSDLTPLNKERSIDDSIKHYWVIKDALKKDPKSLFLQKKLACTKAIIEVTCRHFEYWEKLLVFSTLDNASNTIDIQQEVDSINKKLTPELANEIKQFTQHTYNFN